MNPYRQPTCMTSLVPIGEVLVRYSSVGPWTKTVLYEIGRCALPLGHAGQCSTDDARVAELGAKR